MINAAYSAEAAPPANAAKMDNGPRELDDATGCLESQINQLLRGGLLSHAGQFRVELFIPLRRSFPGKIARHGAAH
jgi:hypothetical protein